jgi:hypothetical protein
LHASPFVLTCNLYAGVPDLQGTDKKDKARVARAYNKKVRPKSFQITELVWKTILPLGTKDVKFGKWSPS